MTNRVRIATKDAQEILLSSGEWAAIVMAAENAGLPAELRGLCINVRDTVRQSLVIRMDDPVIAARIEGALGALVGVGLLSEATRDALLALAEPSAAPIDPPRVRLNRGHPVLNGAMVVLNTGEYRLDEAVECARADAPDQSYCAFLCSTIVGES
ncbi:MAG: hypothetical protein ING02_14595 [Roseomonas sp.]|nr:hypothetical protein [Roseomonas sp.]